MLNIGLQFFAHKKGVRHALGADLLDLNLGIGLTVALTLAVALLGVILEDADLLACYNRQAALNGPKCVFGRRLRQRARKGARSSAS
mgnify:CR=1 FL=1